MIRVGVSESDDGSVRVLPPSYESVVVEDAMQDEEDIKNNPTTVIDVLYGHELPQYLETLKSVLTSNNSSLLEIENVLQNAIQQSFSAVNDHRRKKSSQISTRWTRSQQIRNGNSRSDSI